MWSFVDGDNFPRTESLTTRCIASLTVLHWLLSVRARLDTVQKAGLLASRRLLPLVATTEEIHGTLCLLLFLLLFFLFFLLRLSLAALGGLVMCRGG